MKPRKGFHPFFFMSHKPLIFITSFLLFIPVVILFRNAVWCPWSGCNYPYELAGGLALLVGLSTVVGVIYYSFSSRTYPLVILSFSHATSLFMLFVVRSRIFSVPVFDIGSILFLLVLLAPFVGLYLCVKELYFLKSVSA